jgi:hypothetical protein
MGRVQDAKKSRSSFRDDDFALGFVLAACRTRTASEEDDKKAAISVVLAHELACQTYDFDKEDSLHTPDARVIEESYPHPLEPEQRRSYQVYKDAGIRIDYHPQGCSGGSAG